MVSQTFSQRSTLKLRFKSRQADIVLVRPFAGALYKFTNLQHLDLDLQWCCKLADDAFAALADGLAQLQALESIHLDLQRIGQVVPVKRRYRFAPDKMTDRTPMALAVAFKQCRRIRILDLNFYMCNQLTDAGVIKLSESIAELVNLQHLKLNFLGCRNLTEEATKGLAEALIKLPVLEKVYVDVGGNRIKFSEMARFEQCVKGVLVGKRCCSLSGAGNCAHD